MNAPTILAEKSRSAAGDWAVWAVLGALLSLGFVGGMGLMPGRGLSKVEAPSPAAPPPAPQNAAAPAVASVVRPVEGESLGGFEVRQILVQYEKSWRAPASLTRPQADAKTRAEQALAKLKSGAGWTAVLNEYTDSPEAKEKDGSLGIVKKGQTSHFIEKAVLALKTPGELSPVFETPFGFHIFQRR